MADEIERKFLVSSDAWRGGPPGVRICQGYLTRDAERTVVELENEASARLSARERETLIRLLQKIYHPPGA